MVSSGYTTSTDMANVIPTVVAPARDVIEKPTFMTQMVTKITLKDGDGTSYNWPKFGTQLTAQALAEGVPINNPQRLIPTTQQFTPSEIGVEVIITDKAARVTPEAMFARAGRFTGNAIKRQRESDLLGLFSGLSRDLGTADNPFVPGFLSAAQVRLIAASGTGADVNATEPAEDMPVMAVLHPFHYHDVLTSAATLGSNINSTSGYFPIQNLTEELIREYRIVDLYDCAVSRHSLISIDGSGDAISAVFTKEAFIYLRTSVSMKREQERDIHLRALDMVLTTEYGTGELEDQFGFKITADASVPAS